MARDKHPPETLRDHLKAETGIDVRTCYQCGKCSAGCPMAEEMSLRTHEIVRLFGDNRLERLLQDDSIWLCLSCETCSGRCPNACEPAQVIDHLREIAGQQRGALGPRKVRAFHQAFLKQIYAHGRVFELGLVMGYKLRTGAFFSDITVAPGIFTRGKLSLRPHRIEAIAEVRQIFERCGVWDSPPGEDEA